MSTHEDVLHATFRIYSCPGGGFVIAGVHEQGEQEMKRAVSNIDEAIGAVGNEIRDWHAESQRFRAAQIEEDNPKVIKPSRFWWRKAIG